MTSDDLKTGNWLLETCRQNGIAPAAGMKFLTTHFRAPTLRRNFSSIRREFPREHATDIHLRFQPVRGGAPFAA